MAATDERIGLMVIECAHWTLLDLVNGEPRPLSIGEVLDVWTAPELQSLNRSAQTRSVEAADIRESVVVDPSQVFVLHEPVVLRLDAGRFLAWSEESAAHVELSLAHLTLLELLRSPASLEALTEADPQAEKWLGQLLSLALVKSTAGKPADGTNLDTLKNDEASLGHGLGEIVEQFEMPNSYEVPEEDDREVAADESEASEAVLSAVLPSREAAPGESVEIVDLDLSPSVAEPIPGIFEGLPDGRAAKAHVLLYRAVGRTRRAVRQRGFRRNPTAPTTINLELPPDSRLYPPETEVLRSPADEDPFADSLEPISEPVEVDEVQAEGEVVEVDEVQAEGEVVEVDEVQAEDEAVGVDQVQDETVGGDHVQLEVHSDGETGDVLRESSAGTHCEPDGRIQVIPLYCWGAVSDDQGFSAMVEPSLSIGMICAAARVFENGRLLETYNLQKIQKDAFAVVEEWERNPLPSIFVFSDYIWNLEVHLELSERVKRASPDSICLHGGPSVPKYKDDLDKFFRDNPSVDVAAQGEGEVTFSEILDKLDGCLGPTATQKLADTRGISFRLGTNDGYEVVKTPSRERIADLNVYPSPYLSGEFDDLLGVPWRSASFETNRGCPYGCTFCDWGSVTNSRIRKFDLDRVKDDLEWVAKNAAPSEMQITDANFGIFSRDVEIAQFIADLRSETGSPYSLTISLAKNTVKYSQQIIEILVAADVSPITATSAVQSFDTDTLAAVERQNIKLEKYEELAVTFMEQGIPLVTDLLMGLPGATLASFKSDLQHCFEREVTPRTMEIMMLPNSPMNAPNYKKKWKLVVDDNGVLVGSSTYSREDYTTMQQLRLLYRACDHFGLLRHVLHYLEWEHDLRSIDVMARINDTVNESGHRYPLLAFVSRLFDIYTVPPVAWDPFYEEVEQFLQESYGIVADSALRTVFAVQKAVMPLRGRSYPITVHLDHDFEAYRSDRIADRRGQLAIRRPLRKYPASSLTVTDPGQVTDRYIKRNDYPGRRSATTGNLFWVGYDWELDSPFVRHLATNVGRFDRELV